MGIPDDAATPDNPEALGGKGYLDRQCQGTNYRSSVHQAEFVRRMDLSTCRKHCDSFDKFCRDVEELVKAVAPVAGSSGSVADPERA